MMTNNIKFLPRTCKEKEKGVIYTVCVEGVEGGCFVMKKNPMDSNHILSALFKIAASNKISSY